MDKFYKNPLLCFSVLSGILSLPILAQANTSEEDLTQYQYDENIFIDFSALDLEQPAPPINLLMPSIEPKPELISSIEKQASKIEIKTEQPAKSIESKEILHTQSQKTIEQTRGTNTSKQLITLNKSPKLTIATDKEEIPASVPITPVITSVSLSVSSQSPTISETKDLNKNNEILEVINESGEVFWLNFAPTVTEANRFHKEYIERIYKEKINKRPQTIRIISYAKISRSDSPYAQRISLGRANSVKRLLLSFGVKEQDIEIKSWGNQVAQDRVYIELIPTTP